MVNPFMRKNQIPVHHQKRLVAISNYLRELRYSENMTQREVCREIDLHVNTLKRIEGNQNYSVLSLFQLADFYNISPSELLSILD